MSDGAHHASPHAAASGLPQRINMLKRLFSRDVMARKVSPQVSSILLAFAVLFFLASVFAAVGAGVTARGNDLFISGNVGIGTAGPGAKLDVEYNLGAAPGSSPGLIVRNIAGANFGQAEITLDPASVGSSWTLSANDDVTKFKIFRGATADFTIDGSGNVGIGTANPESFAKLDVAGSLRVHSATEGNIYLENDDRTHGCLIQALVVACPGGGSVLYSQAGTNLCVHCW